MMPGDDQGEEDDAEDERRRIAAGVDEIQPTLSDTAAADQQHAQRDEERDRLLPAGHRGIYAECKLQSSKCKGS